MISLNGKRILLLVSGGIAAYKSPDVVRRLRDAGAEVRVIMTPSATEFITPLTLQAVSGHAVRCDLFDPTAEAAMGHIELARWGDAVVTAPATADFLARLRLGQANDLATAVCLVSAAPVLVAPAMNQQMWQHPATAENLAALTARGVIICGPGSGSQACGEVGPGRMAEADEIVSAVARIFATGRLAGRRVLITAGPTREPIDPVRYISNHSSGKMGYALAIAAHEAGALVTLVSGPTVQTKPEGVTVKSVETAAEMYSAVMQELETTEIFVGTAAVADYRPEFASAGKIKRDGSALELRLVPNRDILAAVAASANAPFTVGFAAETDNLIANAESKLQRKKLDMIAANLVGGHEIGFNSDDNELTVLWPGSSKVLERAPKLRLARSLLEVIVERFESRNSGSN
jgi:phosphopantothenoylcysteine decarboxylase / phosphopantothenate---cysteine ligase